MSRLTRLANLFRRKALDRDLDQELQFHLDMRIERNLRRGLSYEDAVADAQRRFGDAAAAKEDMRMTRLFALSRSQTAGLVVAAGLIVAIAVTAMTYRQRLAEPFDQNAERADTMPVLVKEEKPRYTEAALKGRITGAVWLQCVVQTTGVCTDFRITKALDPGGLDEQALMAARNWRFQPGTRNGQPVPVPVTVEMRFTLRDDATKGSSRE